MRAAAAFALAVVLCLAAGCVLFTGSTEGYSLIDAGASSCTAAAQCDAGSVCCLVISASTTTSTSGTCQASCRLTYPQLCTTNAECGDAGPCSRQSCSVEAGGGLSVPLQACGVFPECTATP